MYLIDKGANNQSALSAAAGNGYLEVVKYLVDKGDNSNALQQAIKNGHLEVVKLLLEMIICHW